ncbi:Arc family DNA-binding protein [Pseudaminobacter salicylatoxidans]|nr:Arc family DNA-binding protein [Pseudaminobacter salicylatoxidans]
MTKPEIAHFHVRMPKRIKDELEARAAGESLNKEIVQRLERTLGPDDAVVRLAEILKPLMDTLSAADQATLIAAARILAKDRRKQAEASKKK